MLAAASMNIQFFQMGTNYNKLRTAFDTATASSKEKEQGLNVSYAVEQIERVNEQLQQVVRETNLRNAKRNPSSSAMVTDEFNDLPPLIPLSELDNKEIAYSENHYLRGHLSEID
jgi:nitrate reductase cytochrome c-type subunit